MHAFPELLYTNNQRQTVAPPHLHQALWTGAAPTSSDPSYPSGRTPDTGAGGAGRGGAHLLASGSTGFTVTSDGAAHTGAVDRDGLAHNGAPTAGLGAPISSTLPDDEGGNTVAPSVWDVSASNSSVSALGRKTSTASPSGSHLPGLNPAAAPFQLPSTAPRSAEAAQPTNGGFSPPNAFPSTYLTDVNTAASMEEMMRMAAMQNMTRGYGAQGTGLVGAHDHTVLSPTAAGQCMVYAAAYNAPFAGGGAKGITSLTGGGGGKTTAGGLAFPMGVNGFPKAPVVVGRPSSGCPAGVGGFHYGAVPGYGLEFPLGHGGMFYSAADVCATGPAITAPDLEDLQRVQVTRYRAKMLPRPLALRVHRDIWAMNNNYAARKPDHRLTQKFEGTTTLTAGNHGGSDQTAHPQHESDLESPAAGGDDKDGSDGEAKQPDPIRATKATVGSDIRHHTPPVATGTTHANPAGEASTLADEERHRSLGGSPTGKGEAADTDPNGKAIRESPSSSGLGTEAGETNPDGEDDDSGKRAGRLATGPAPTADRHAQPVGGPHTVGADVDSIDAVETPAERQQRLSAYRIILERWCSHIHVLERKFDVRAKILLPSRPCPSFEEFAPAGSGADANALLDEEAAITAWSDASMAWWEETMTLQQQQLAQRRAAAPGVGSGEVPGTFTVTAPVVPREQFTVTASEDHLAVPAVARHRGGDGALLGHDGTFFRGTGQPMANAGVRSAGMIANPVAAMGTNHIGVNLAATPPPTTTTSFRTAPASYYTTVAAAAAGAATVSMGGGSLSPHKIVHGHNTHLNAYGGGYGSVNALKAEGSGLLYQSTANTSGGAASDEDLFVDDDALAEAYQRQLLKVIEEEE